MRSHLREYARSAYICIRLTVLDYSTRASRPHTRQCAHAAPGRSHATLRAPTPRRGVPSIEPTARGRDEDIPRTAQPRPPPSPSQSQLARPSPHPDNSPVPQPLAPAPPQHPGLLLGSTRRLRALFLSEPHGAPPGATGLRQHTPRTPRVISALPPLSPSLAQIPSGLRKGAGTVAPVPNVHATSARRRRGGCTARPSHIPLHTRLPSPPRTNNNGVARLASVGTAARGVAQSAAPPARATRSSQRENRRSNRRCNRRSNDSV